MSHSRRNDTLWREAPETVCGRCKQPQSHHGLCVTCMRLEELAALPEPDADAAPAPEPPVALPPPQPLRTALADLLGGAL